MKTIFYSWMSDHPNSTNRGFIKSALEKAAKALSDAGTVEEAPRIDHDTQGVPGAPDIFASRFNEFAAAVYCLSDNARA